MAIFMLDWILPFSIFGIVFNVLILPPIAFLVLIFTGYDLNSLWALYSTIAAMG
jgi:hypothetical protein